MASTSPISFASAETLGSLLAVALALLTPIIFGLVVIAGLIALLVWGLRRLLRPAPAT